MIAKDSSERIVCTRCSRPAQEGSDPPLCEICWTHPSEIEKLAQENCAAALREATAKGFNHDQ